MKIKLSHLSYMARKISNDIMSNTHINVAIEKDELIENIEVILEQEITREIKLEEEVTSMLDDVEDNIVDEFEYMDINYRQVFWMAKKKLAKKHGFILDEQDRYTDISHQIIHILVHQNLIDYSMSETVIKNFVFDSIMSFMQLFKDIEKLVNERISHYKRRLIPGTEDYDLVYKKLYEESLARKGLV